MDSDEQKKTGFKVVDRRRFDSAGDDREESSEFHSSTAETVEKAEKGPPMDSPEIGFSSFLMSFATQALMQLGQIPPPEGIDFPVDREGAKHTIEIIAMLERKTKGNLDGDEQRLLSEVLHNLRLCYVKSV